MLIGAFILFASVFKFFFSLTFRNKKSKNFLSCNAHHNENFLFIFVELAESLPGTQRSPYPTRRRKGSLTNLRSNLNAKVFNQKYLNFQSISFVHNFAFSIAKHSTVIGSSSSAKSSTLPLPHRLNVERPYVPKERERDGYYR